MHDSSAKLSFMFKEKKINKFYYILYNAKFLFGSKTCDAAFQFMAKRNLSIGFKNNDIEY